MRYAAAFLVLACSLAVPQARATTFIFDCEVANTCPNSNDAGKMLSSTFEYNDVTDKFTWTASFKRKDGHIPDGFWLVVDNGPEPENLANKSLAILYGDGLTNRASAYVFDNDEKKNSWKDSGGFIETFPNTVFFTDTPDGNALTFEIDATDLNDAFLSPWQGLSFDQSIGFWVHALSGTQIDFGPAGMISDFRYDENSSYDRHDRDTVPHNDVPEPTTILLAACGFLGLGWVNGRRARRR